MIILPAMLGVSHAAAKDNYDWEGPVLHSRLLKRLLLVNTQAQFRLHGIIEEYVYQGSDRQNRANS